MKLFYLSILLTLCFISCSKEEAYELPELPKCIKEQIEENNQSLPIKTVKVQKLNGVFHFWINTDARHIDYLEDIVSSECEKLCFLCTECTRPDCMEDYNSEWRTIWEQ